MNVLLVAEDPISLEIAPAARIHHIGKALNKFGVKTTIIPRQHQLNRFLKGNNRFKKYLRRVYLLCKMLCIVKTKKVEYFLLRNFYIGLEGILIAKIFGIKSIFDFHGFVWKEEIHRGHKFRPFLTKILEEMCIKKSDLIITQIESNRDAIKALNRNVLVVENGIDLSEFVDLNPSKSILCKYSIPTTKPIIGFIGNWENWMRIEDLLYASRYLNAVLVVIIGKGRNFRKYRDEFKNVSFTGRIPHKDAMSILIHFDICILPHSKDEIMQYKSAMKTLEYITAGKPIIVSNVIGKEKWLVDGVHCLTYEPENPMDLANKIKILLEDTKLRRKMGINNKILVEGLTWEKNIKRSGLIDILEKWQN